MTQAVSGARPARIPRHLLVAGSAWASRVVTAVIQLASVRILMQTLGLDAYAAFALLAGLIGWFGLSDLGMGTSLQNHISERRAAERSYEDLIGMVSALAGALLAALVGVFYLVSPYLGPLFFQNIPSLGAAEKGTLFFVNAVILSGYGVGSIAYKIWYAEHRGHWANIVPALAALFGLGGLLLVRAAAPAEPLLASLALFVGPTALLPLGALLVRNLRSRAAFRWSGQGPALGALLRRAGRFWCFALMSAAILQIDYIVMSQFLLAQDIATYNLATKMFGLAFFIYNAILMALWPVLSEAFARRQWGVADAYLRKYLGLGLLYMALCTLALLWLMPVAVELLAPGQALAVPAALILALGLYQMIRVWSDTFAMVLQSMNALSVFWICMPLQAALSIALQWLLTPIYGVYGVVVGLIVSFALTVVWALPLTLRKHHHLQRSDTP